MIDERRAGGNAGIFNMITDLVVHQNSGVCP